jgi:hypothetical protein
VVVVVVGGVDDAWCVVRGAVRKRAESPRHVGLTPGDDGDESRRGDGARVIGQHAKPRSRGMAAGRALGGLVKGGSSSFLLWLLWHQTKAVQDSPMLRVNVMW